METNNKVIKDLRFDSYPAPLEQVTAYARKYSQTAEVKGHHFTQLVVSLLLKWAQGLSWKTAYRVGSSIGHLFYRLRLRRDVAMTNLDIVYGKTTVTGKTKKFYKMPIIERKG